MQPDYTLQLEEIVRALNRESIPTWLIAITSAFFGFLASVLGQIFQHWYGEHRARSKMRMIIYSEIGAMYSQLVDLQPDMVSEPPTQQDFDWRKLQFRIRFLNYQGEKYAEKFEGEKYADDKRDVFIQLKERSTIISIYSAIRDVFGPEEEYGFLINSGLAIEIIEDCVRLNDLPGKFVKRYMNGADVAAIQNPRITNFESVFRYS
jgi:hypothetical protein